MGHTSGLQAKLSKFLVRVQVSLLLLSKVSLFIPGKTNW